MALTTNEKNYICDNFGLGTPLKCAVATGLSWTVTSALDGEVIAESGGTGQILARIISSAVASLTINSITYTNASVTAAIGRQLVNADVFEIGANDGSPPTENQYCFVCQPPSCSFNMT